MTETPISSNGRGYSIIYSAGRTATQWLTSAMNLHPDIFFSHGLDLNPRKRMTTAEYVEASNERHKQPADFDFNRIDDYFDIMERIRDHKVYGNIHGLRIHPYTQYRRNYRLCALVRNPALRVASFVNKWMGSSLATPTDPIYNNEHAREICQRYAIDPTTPGALYFIAAVRFTVTSDRDFIAMKIPVFQMEQFCDQQYFRKMFDYLTFGIVEFGDDYAASVQRLPPIDPLAKETIAPLLMRSWHPWQRRLLSDTIDQNDMRETYEALGYRLN